MIALFGALLGFLSAAFPDLLKLFRDTQDRGHELKILELQIEQQRLGPVNRLEEIQVNADIAAAMFGGGAKAEAKTRALYPTYRTDIDCFSAFGKGASAKHRFGCWVDALNGTVRPVIAYSFFVLYAVIKAMQFSLMFLTPPGNIPTSLDMSWVLWTPEDQAIFAGMISFYFVQRAMAKLRAAK